MAPIKSKADLQRYNADVSARNNPLNKLTPGSRKRFIDSLVFNENGIAGFRYGDLEAELTVTEIYRIMALFGAQHTVAMMRNARVETETDRAILSAQGAQMLPDYNNYRCSSRAICSMSAHDICMSSC